jgi:Domain of unknown function (DUF4157)/Putative RNase-like toxin, toxin_1
MPEAAHVSSLLDARNVSHPATASKRPCACAGTGESCARCKGDTVVQRRSLDGSREPLADVPDAVRETIDRPGRSLDPAMQQRMEGHFGTSFAKVRVHTDAAAASSAAGINAAAYAVGDNVVFNRGYYQPETRMGQGLLAHELTHVVQQSRGGGHGEAIGPGHEHEADRAAEALSTPDRPFNVSGRAAMGVGPLSFGELQKKVWAQVPEVAKPYLRPLAQEAREQVEKVIPHDVQIPPSVAVVIEQPVESAKKAAVKLGQKAKAELRDQAMGQAGTMKGLVMEGTSIVDTLIWAGYESGKNYGLVDAKTEAPIISEAVGGGIDRWVKKGETKVFGDLPPEQALVFDSYETGELKGAIGSQVALGFVGVEEVQLALKAVGVLGSLRGLMLLLKSQGTAGWYKNPEFVGALLGIVLSFLSLKSTKAASKIINIVMASGSLISAGPAVWKLYNDWHDIPEGDPKRDKTLKRDFGDLVKLLANIVVDIVRHQSSKHGPGNKGKAAAAGDEAIAPTGKPAATEIPVPGAVHAEQPAPRLAVEAPVVNTPAAATVAAPAPTRHGAARPSDPGLASRGVRPKAGTRNESKAQWKARDSAERRARRIEETMARIDAEAKHAPVDMAEPGVKPGGAMEGAGTEPGSTKRSAPESGGPIEAKPAGPAEHPADSTGVTKREATAVEPAGKDHEAVVNKRGVGVCSPEPCPVIHVEYAFELKQDPKFAARNKAIQGMRTAQPKKAAKLAAKLIADLEGHRQAGLDREFGDFSKLTGKGGLQTEGDIVRMQPHSKAASYREAHGLQGRESAHLAAQALMKQVPGWSKGQALTLLLRSQDHRGTTGMDHFWKNDMDALRARTPSGKASAKAMYDVFASAVDKTNLPAGEKSSIKARLFDEMFVDNAMKPDALFNIPRGYRK